MLCQDCGKVINNDSKYCNYCGSDVNHSNVKNYNDNETDKTTNSTDNNIFNKENYEGKENSQEDINENIFYPAKKKNKKGRVRKVLRIGCGSVLIFFAFIIIMGIIISKGTAKLVLNDIDKEISEDKITITGVTDYGNTLKCNGKDYSHTISSNGEFRIVIPLDIIGENTINIFSMKTDNEKSKNEKSITINRINKDFTISFNPESNSQIEDEKIKVVGYIKEPNVKIEILGDDVEYDLNSNKYGEFEFDIIMRELGIYIYNISCEKAGFNFLNTKFSLERIAPIIDLTIEGIDSIIHINSITIKGKTKPNTKLTFTGDINLEKMANNNGDFSVKIDTKNEKEYFVEINASKEGFTNNKKTVSFLRELTIEEKIAQYAIDCESLSYKELKKNPDKHIGKKVKYNGKVLEVTESEGKTVMRIAVTKLNYGIWDFNDAIWVTFDGETSAVEDSIISVYGDITGSFSYTSIAGWKITIPSIKAKYIK